MAERAAGTAAPRFETAFERIRIFRKPANCRKDYRVLSWEADTCCTRQGFPDDRFQKDGKACCNKFPKFVDDQAVKLGFDGAASCRSTTFLNHSATVTPDGKKGTPVKVLCVDTRAKTNLRTIELGFNAAQKAYGSTKLDEPATVCISDGKEADTCYFDSKCVAGPKESDCLKPGCAPVKDKTAPEKKKS
jgi:hypothetical protein